MENEMTIIDGQEYSYGQEAIAAKKIKVNDEKLRGISSHRIITKEEVTVPEEPMITEEPVVTEEDIKVEEPVVEDMPFMNNFALPKEGKEEPVMEFAYKANKLEEEIDPEKIQEIKGLGDTYKGAPKPEFKKVFEERPLKEEKKVTTEQFVSALEEESYSPKTRKYKETMKNAYNEIIDKLEAQNRETENIMHMYKNATKIGGDLQEVKNEAQAVLEGINALKLEFLMDKKDEKSITVLRALEDLFNENKEVIISTTNELKKNDEKKKEIGRNEQISKTKADEIKLEKEKFEEDNYSKLIQLNKTDEKLRELNNGLTEFTGIVDRDTEIESERETVSSISNLKDMPSMDMNHFDSLREEPQPVVGINPYIANQNYNDMSFGGRAM